MRLPTGFAALSQRAFVNLLIEGIEVLYARHLTFTFWLAKEDMT